MAYCTNCGAPISDGAKFCENCGAPVERPSARTTTPPKTVAPVMPVPQEREDASTLSPTSSESRLAAAQPPAGSSIIQGNDGTFRWVFEYSLWRDVTVFFTVFKVFFGVGLGLVLFMEILNWIDGSWDIVSMEERLRFDAAILGLACGLAIVGYVIFALMQGGSYCVMFTMDDESVEFQPLPKEMKRAEAISAINVLMGLATNNPTQIGIGLTTADSTMTSNFKNVRSIQGYPRRGVIKVNEPFAKNQVYVEKGDYDFVYNYIRERCPNAKIRG